MTGQILLFGRLRDVFGVDAIDLPDGVSTVADLRGALGSTYPDHAHLFEGKVTRVAVNQMLVADESKTSVDAQDEIALMPPLSGG